MHSNSQSAAIGAAKASFGIQEARDALKLEGLHVAPAHAMDTEQVLQFADILLEVESAGTETIARHRRERLGGMVKLWNSSPTIAPIAGTRWAASNAVTEYRDHIVPIRDARTAGDASAASALRSITAAASAGSVKAQAFRMLQTL